MSEIVSSAPPDATAVETVHPTARRGFVLLRRHLWVIAPLALIWIFQSVGTIEPFDFWWNLTSGRWMVEHGRFLADDVLVYTPVRLPYSNPQWGAQLLFYAVFALSPALLLLLRAAIVTATYGLIYAACYRRSRSLGWAAVAVLVAYVSGLTNYGMRPQLFAFLPFAAFLWLLERKADHPRALWALAPIMVVWVNVHGSFFLGWGLIGIYAGGTLLDRLGSAAGRAWLGRQWARLELLPMAVAALAAFLNPYGLGIIGYVLSATNDPIARTLNVEWQPPTLYNGTGILFFANVILFLGLLLAARRPVGWTEGFLMGAFGFLALLSLRNCLWWAWVTAPGLAASGTALAARIFAALHLTPTATESTTAPQEEASRVEGYVEPSPQGGEGRVRGESSGEEISQRDIPALNWAIAGLLVVVALIVAPLWRPADKALDKTTPVALGQWLHAQPTLGPLFNYMEWGGYLEWVLYPPQQLFIDGRFEARQPQVWDDYLAISAGKPDWESRLAKYGVQTLILNRGFDVDLIPQVQTDPGWTQVYSDTAALVFTRR